MKLETNEQLIDFEESCDEIKTVIQELLMVALEIRHALDVESIVELYDNEDSENTEH